MNHLSLHQLISSASGEPSPDVRKHLSECSDCRVRLEEIERVEAALRGVLPEETSADFEENVMRRLGIRGASSFAWALFRSLAPLLALTVVGLLTIAILNFFGGLGGSDLQQSATQLQSASGKLAVTVAGGIGAFTHWLATYFSFAFAKNSYGLTAFMICFLGAVALIDRYIVMPRMRKRGL